MNKNALLVDFGNHYKQIRHAAYAWRHYRVDLICGKSAKNNLDLVSDNETILIEDVRHALRFWVGCFFYMICNTFKYSKLIVLTAPEYTTGKTGVFIRLMWLCVCIGYTNRVCIYVKNSNAYGKSILLRLTLKFAAKVFFESKVQMDYFEKNILVGNNNFAVSYVYYSDIPNGEKQHANNEKLDQMRTDGNIVVGLIGAFDTSRRNYESLISAHDKGLLKGLSFVQIGRFVGDTQTKQRLLPFTTFLRDEFSVEELDELLGNCDVLLSMNTDSLGYQSHKGTAAFSEAASLSKPLVVPKFMEVHSEYRDFCFYYNDAKSLVMAIKASTNELDPNIFKRFSSTLIQRIEFT